MCPSHNISTILTDVLTHPAATCCHPQPGWVSPMTLIMTGQGNITSRVRLWSSRLNPLCWYNVLTSASALRTVSIKQAVIFISGSILRNSLKLEDILFLPCSGCLHRSWWTYSDERLCDMLSVMVQKRRRRWRSAPQEENLPSLTCTWCIFIVCLLVCLCHGNFLTSALLTLIIPDCYHDMCRDKEPHLRPGKSRQVQF